MRTLFYNIVETITENITGLENGNLKIWQLSTWFDTTDKVGFMINLICLVMLLTVIVTVCEIIIRRNESK